MKKTPMEITPMKKIITSISVLICLTLAGCSGAANFTDGDAQNRNIVEMIRLAYDVTFEANTSSLSTGEIQQLDTFMMNSNVSYGDELSMDFPLERDGSLSPQNQNRMVFLTELLKQRGLHLSPMVTPYGMSPAKDQARFLISRYVVTPPQCGDWSQPSTDNYGNTNMPNFGCTSQARLGLMVANPRDLITGVTSAGPDTGQATQAIRTYRTPTPTASSDANPSEQ